MVVFRGVVIGGKDIRWGSSLRTITRVDNETIRMELRDDLQRKGK